MPTKTRSAVSGSDFGTSASTVRPKGPASARASSSTPSSSSLKSNWRLSNSAGVSPREQQQVVGDRVELVNTMQESLRGGLGIGAAFGIGKDFFNAGAQHGDRRLEVMRGVGRETR